MQAKRGSKIIPSPSNEGKFEIIKNKIVQTIQYKMLNYSKKVQEQKLWNSGNCFIHNTCCILILLLILFYKILIYTPKRLFFGHLLDRYLKSTSTKIYFHKLNINVFFVAFEKMGKKIMKTDKKFFTTFFKNGINLTKIYI